MALIGLDKWKRVFRIIRQHGGPIKSLSKLWRTDTLKVQHFGLMGILYVKACTSKKVRTSWDNVAEYGLNQFFEGGTERKEEGKLVGRDLHGNRYYENDYYFLGRNRWVEFNDKVKFEYDGSQIHPDWYGWLHYKTDCLPCEDPAKMEIACCVWYSCWLLPYEENWSGSVKTFQPYSTTPARVHCWDGGCVKADSSDVPCPSS